MLPEEEEQGLATMGGLNAKTKVYYSSDMCLYTNSAEQNKVFWENKSIKD